MTNSANEATAAMAGLRESYLQLLKSALTMTLWDAGDGSQLQPFGEGLGAKTKNALKRLIKGESGTEVAPDPRRRREEGRDWPMLAHTMIGLKRMNNLQECVEDVIRKDVPGDLIETGVWRGGACIFLRGILKAYGVRDRRVWVADSFEGLPVPNPAKYPADTGDIHHTIRQLAVSIEQVQSHFAKYGLLDEQVKFLKGWFRDTLPSAPIDRLAVARLDGDMYESTMDGLTHLYPKLSRGGYLIVDDYGAVPACKQAVEDYRRTHNITEPIVEIDWGGVHWQRVK
ncbi:MAG TPA: TylF/MycF family methyltransferase [Verrucomicrobiae bacterium]|nr:TylF/MycF family methyltransferase [Verrucomicrobiae bacterium]